MKYNLIDISVYSSFVSQQTIYTIPRQYFNIPYIQEKSVMQENDFLHWHIVKPLYNKASCKDAVVPKELILSHI